MSRKTRIHTNDWLIDDEGHYIYLDSYGDREEIGDIDALYAWAAENGVVIEQELEDWLSGGTNNG